PLRGASPGLVRGSFLGVSGGAAATFWSWRACGSGAGTGTAGAAPGSVALAFQQQVVAGVEDPVQDGLADDRVGEQRVPVGRAAVGGQDQRPAGAADPLGEQLIQVIGLGGGELPHREVVADQQGDPGELADAGLEAAVGVPAGQVGQQPGAGGERHVVAAAAG